MPLPAILRALGFKLYEFGDRFLYEGLYGDDVRELQEFLKVGGAHLPLCFE